MERKPKRRNLTTFAVPAIALAAALSLSCGCARRNYAPEPLSGPTQEQTGATYLPKAQIYRTTCERADLVPVNFSPDGKNIVSYPAPGDLPSTSPVRLAGGWLLDRRGINPATRFTSFTYAEYQAMEHAPTPQELMRNIDQTCRITEIRALPMTTSEAIADTAAVNRMIRTGLYDLPSLYSIPRLKQ